MIKLSVIIPIYNMGKYIENAIECVEQQTLDGIEVICVDDGSTDNSEVVLNKLSGRYENIRIIKQYNQGAGAARNFGIDIARGEFLCFLDADDFYASNDVLETLYLTAKEKNVKICGGSSCDLRDGIISTKGIRKERLIKENQYIDTKMYSGVSGYWAFIFSREYLLEKEIRFPNYLRGQDAVFFVQALANVEKVYCINKMIYVYRKEHKVVVFDEQKAIGLVKSFRDVLIISRHHDMKQIHYVAWNEFCGEVGAVMYKYAHLGSGEMQELIGEINSLVDRELINDKLNKNEMEEFGHFVCENELEKYIEECNLEKEELICKLRQTERVYIFGAGTIGKKVMSFLMDNEVNITSFLVSDEGQNPKDIEDIPIVGIDKINFKDKDYIIIIATFWYSQTEIINLLKERELYNIYPINLRRFYLWQDEIVH